jgi:hypothetical protein
VLAMICLIVLRRKEPELVRPYKVPAYPALPIFVAALSAIAGYLYVWSNVQVILPTIVLYVAAILWYVFWARKRVLPVAPEEVAARIADMLEHQQIVPAEVHVAAATTPSGFIAHATSPILMPADPLYLRQLQSVLERIAGPVLLIGILSLFWMILRARNVVPAVFSEITELTLVTLVWASLFLLVSAVGLLSARHHGR